MAEFRGLGEFLHKKSELHPMIYAYSDISYPGFLKVGYTAINIDKRVAQQYPTKRPDGKVPYKIVLRESAMYSDGTSFSDHDVHRMLKKKKIKCQGGEWFKCSVSDVEAAILAVRNRVQNIQNRTQDFKMRPEQDEAVNTTIAYYESAIKEGRIPKFLWNAKMRFGKTFAAYELAKKMNFKRVLVLTFKPAVQVAWRDDLMTHIDFEGWQFISRPQNSFEPDINEQYLMADKDKPIVCFGSFQDFLGVDKETGGIKAHNAWVHTTNWDLVIFDEYHFGAWKSNAKSLFEFNDENFDEDLENYDRGDAYDETWLPITTNYYLFLSGTPFRALNSGEFIEEQIYNWTYTDEQKAKQDWVGANNPYLPLPKMVMMTYKIPESIQRIAKQGEFDEFDLNIFFKADGIGDKAKFVYKDYVQKWLNLIRGAYLETTVDELKLGAKKPPMPFSDTTLLNVLSHTLWYLPSVASCFAMRNLLLEKQNVFYHDYKINVCAGTQAGVGAKALEPVLESMGDPLTTKTITLSCGKLLTGVTVKPWSGIFMLCNLSSPETYFQAAFRVQSPWEVPGENGIKEIIKHECYVFDFALDRALRQISDYSCRLNVNESNPEKKVSDFISFLPVLAYDGSAMRQVNAGEILDIAMSGTSATLLAKRWESALLVNVDNETLERLLSNEQAMEALSNIKDFRTLNQDIITIINKSNAVKKAKKGGGNISNKEKKQLTEAEKEYKSKRKMIQEKLIKFATRVPIFMYLTDYREYSLKDVITQLEPRLFKRVTGLDVKDFELLVSLNVFNESLMNDAVYKFKRYEDSSLSYTGVDRHADENIGLYSTVISREDYEAMAGQLLSSMTLGKPMKKKAHKPIKQYNFSIADTAGAAAASKDNSEERDSMINGTYHTSSKSSISKDKSSVRKSSSGAKMNGSSNKPANDKNQSSSSEFMKSSVLNDNSTLSKQQPKNEKKTVDYSHIKAGSIVSHKAFGNGTVKEIRDGKIIVMFGNEKKMFMYPGAFKQGFLS